MPREDLEFYLPAADEALIAEKDEPTPNPYEQPEFDGVQDPEAVEDNDAGS